MYLVFTHMPGESNVTVDDSSLCYYVRVAPLFINRRFPEITGKDNLSVFSFSGRVKSPEWRRQLRRADLRQF